MDEYFSGTNHYTQKAAVRDTLDTVVQELAKRPHWKFCYGEMGFFKLWYEAQDKEIQDLTKKLIKNGQLEIVGGGWSGNDEACPNFEDIINNFIIGHDFLKSEFGIVPKIGWNIDDFGHSDTNARIFGLMGYEAMFFSRLDHNDKDQRSKKENQAMNYLWRPSFNHFGVQNQVLTSVFKTDYCFPTGFSFGENYDSDDPFIADKSLTSFNADEKLIDLVNFVQDISTQRRGQNVMVPMGCDFDYSNAYMELM